MNRLAIALCCTLFVLAAATPLRAEKPVASGMKFDTVVSPGEVKATPDMWFYEQNLRLYKDPKMAVRAQAEFRARQRQLRIESMKWFGMSNSRPRVNGDPLHGDYSASWVATPGYYPMRWNGVSRP
jgi:hypothetical protein